MLGMNNRLRDDDAMLQRGSPRSCAPERGCTRVFSLVVGQLLCRPAPPWFDAGGVLKTGRRLILHGLRGHFSVTQRLALLLHLGVDSSDYHGALVFPVRFSGSALSKDILSAAARYAPVWCS